MCLYVWRGRVRKLECSIVLKFDALMYYGFPATAELLKPISGQIENCKTCPNLTYLNAANPPRIVRVHKIRYIGPLWVLGGRAVVEIHLPWNPWWRTAQNWKCLYHYNSVVGCPIAPKFGTMVHYGDAERIGLINHNKSREQLTQLAASSCNTSQLLAMRRNCHLYLFNYKLWTLIRTIVRVAGCKVRHKVARAPRTGPSLPVPVELVSGDVFIDAPEREC